ncbi:MAG: PDZ domain-containing protein [Chloroflexaceae bacterium]|nr:PDZ domain-containing protein [Chloroflexaceae bacterium]
MSERTQINITILIVLAMLVSITGGAITGGIIGYLFAQRSVAEVPDMVEKLASGQSLGAASAPAILNANGEIANPSALTVAAVKRVAPAVVTVINRNAGDAGSGSGVVISNEGHIITNHHVVENAEQLSVVFADSSRQEATLIGSDPLSDIAIIKIDGQVPAVAAIGSSEILEPGEMVIAIGSPLGNFRNTVTSGIVSALNRSVGNFEGLIQTDASINRGNSGGPLINLRGEVVGINTLVVRGNGVMLGGDQAEGLGFAVPSTIFKNVSTQLIDTGQMKYPYLGIRYNMIDGEIAAEQSLPVQSGAFVASVEPNTPAEQAGLQADDIVIAVNGTSLAVDNSLRYVLTQYRPGDTVKLTVQRGSEELTLDVTLGTRPANLDVIPPQGFPIPPVPPLPEDDGGEP